MKAFYLISLGVVMVIYRLVKIKDFFELGEISFCMFSFLDMTVNLSPNMGLYVSHTVDREETEIDDCKSQMLLCKSNAISA